MSKAIQANCIRVVSLSVPSVSMSNIKSNLGLPILLTSQIILSYLIIIHYFVNLVKSYFSIFVEYNDISS